MRKYLIEHTLVKDMKIKIEDIQTRLAGAFSLYSVTAGCSKSGSAMLRTHR
jgi:hypothetical protein